jgi:hypothetical protein
MVVPLQCSPKDCLIYTSKRAGYTTRRVGKPIMRTEPGIMSNLNDLLAKIESQQLWSYFHKEWLIEIRSQIRRQLPATHYVFIESESTLIAPARLKSKRGRCPMKSITSTA